MGAKNYLADIQSSVSSTIDALLPSDRADTGKLYEVMRDYPFREGKALRPALCCATHQLFGGQAGEIQKTAAVLELFHNAALIHDDYEDGSLFRRGQPALHRKYGQAIAVNVGDAMLVMTLAPLLGNIETLGLSRALRILRIFARMAQKSVEGQMMELQLVREQRWQLSDTSYLRLVHKKTTWYSFMGPMMIGAVAAGAEQRDVLRCARFAKNLGVAFQITDDLLNVTDVKSRGGKELNGDLWEGKMTLLLIHALRSAKPNKREALEKILIRPRPEKSEQDVSTLAEAIEDSGAIPYAKSVAAKSAARARRNFAEIAHSVGRDSTHLKFLDELVDYVTQRDN